MPVNKAKKWNVPKLWRLHATAPDGVSVTLGRYETEDQARADCQVFAAQGKYKRLVVEPIKQPPKEDSDENPPAS